MGTPKTAVPYKAKAKTKKDPTCDFCGGSDIVTGKAPRCGHCNRVVRGKMCAACREAVRKAEWCSSEAGADKEKSEDES
jgi:hypothetical protein